MTEFSKSQINNIAEIKAGIADWESIKRQASKGSVVVVVGRNRPVAIGYGMLGTVITPVGLGAKGSKSEEMSKIQRLASLQYGPDIIIDLSVRDEGEPLYAELARSLDGPVATVPVYRVFHPKKGIDKNVLLETIEEQAQAGVNYMVIHASVTKDLYDLSLKTRPFVPYTSRGGSSVIRDMIFKKETEGVYMKNFDALLKILKKYNVTLSLATSFRPASNIDANDAVHLKEFMIQAQLIKEAREAGVPVVLEALTHATFEQMLKFRKFIDQNPPLDNVPLGSLGPLGTDAAPGFDHAVMAATASFAYFHNVCHFVTPVTRVEHTGGVPSEENILEALRMIRASFRVGEVAKYPQLDRAIGLMKGDGDQTCILLEGKGIFPDTHVNVEKPGPCTRCGSLCPYLDKRLLRDR